MIEHLIEQARRASLSLLELDEKQINDVLNKLADALEANADAIIAANAKDLSRMDPADYRYDRLLLNASRISGIASDTRNVASLPSPLNIQLSEAVRPNGMVIRKVSVPFGVIGVIYEARPNVTIDVFSLCFKAGSAVILKGGKEAADSNDCEVVIIHKVLREAGLPEGLCILLPNDHAATAELLNAVGKVDLIIPRGSRRLIDFVRDTAKVPVIETGAGVVNTYFDKDGDLEKGQRIVTNAKTRRVSVCNALDCLLIHKEKLVELFKLVEPLAKKNVIIYADDEAYNALDGSYPYLEHATADSFGTEFMDYKMAIRTVASLDEALDHINRYGSGHSESIITENEQTARRFQMEVDAACVYWNAPTSFTDGAQFGLGAEIGISTQKLGPRGPMGLEEMTTYKWIIEGEGQIRE